MMKTKILQPIKNVMKTGLTNFTKNVLKIYAKSEGELVNDLKKFLVIGFKIEEITEMMRRLKTQSLTYVI